MTRLGERGRLMPGHMMNIGYVVSRFPKTTETFIAREACGVTEFGHDVTMVAINREPNEIVQPEAAGFLGDLTAISDASPVELVQSQLRWLRRSPARLARMWQRSLIGNIGSPTFLARAAVTAIGAPWAADRLTQQGVDHLHAHWGTHSALFAHQLSLLTDLPYSVTLHAHDLYVERSMLHAKLRAAAAVVTISEHNRLMIAELYPDVADRVEVVHCGVDVGAITPRESAPTNSPPVLTVVAGLRDYKGHRYLLEAQKVLEQRGLAVKLDVIGDGPLREELEALVTGSAIEQLVTFHGARPVDEAIKIVTRSDLFVMPSVVMENGRKDGIPVALMEAMALRVPVVSTRVSGIPELVEHEVTGLLTDERDPVGLADAIERLLTDDGLRERLADAGRQRVVDHFDLSQTVKAMDRIIRRGQALPAAGFLPMTPTGPNPTVAMLTHNYLPAVGGAERQLNSLVPLFIERGITPVIYTRARPGLPSVENINGAEVVRVPVAGPAPMQAILFVVGTLWRLLRRNPEVVHAYDTLTPSLVAGLYRLISGTPYLTKLLRSGEIGDLNRLANKPLGRARLKLLERSVARFVAISRDLENELNERNIGDDRRVFIPNGVDADRFRPPAELVSDPGSDGRSEDPANRWRHRRTVFADWPMAPVVVVVGRLSPEKRVIELAGQWSRFGREVAYGEGPRPWLYVVGEGPLAPELDGIDNVRFLGRREDVPEILRWSDVYVSASSAEGLSNSLLEAMSSGCACVVTDVGGTGDVMSDGVNGRVVEAEGRHRPPETVVADIVERIGELIALPDQRRKLGAAARDVVVNRYSLVATADALADQYRSLATAEASR